MKIEKVESRGYRVLPEGTDCKWGFPTEMYLIDLGDKVLLCDTHTGPECINRVRKFVFSELGEREFMVFNSHAHWDHVAGNCAFSENAAIISSEITFEIMRECMECQFSANRSWIEDKVELRLPNLLFRNRLIFPDHKIEFFLAPGHTPGCACCLDILDNVLFAGDIIEKPVPSFDYYKLDIYANTLENLLSKSYKQIITSHSGSVRRELIQDNLNYIRSFLNITNDSFYAEKYHEAHASNLKMLHISYYEEKWRDVLKESFSFRKFFNIIDFAMSPEAIKERLKYLDPKEISNDLF